MNNYFAKVKEYLTELEYNIAEQSEEDGFPEQRGEARAARAGRTGGNPMTRKEMLARLIAQADAQDGDLITLRARAKTAAATKKINKQLAKVESSGTIAMLERMKERVEEDESLAEAYGDLAGQPTSADEEIDKALAGGGSSDARLAALKAKMGIEG